ncbi:SurA N-terminal domain-containing protein [Wohlfahrtiimonas chitiniclastica]|uniref:SurA N-terminal domain-containing protein n=1 Tax=Wohlfahrtiimonas chitiniclastica TaxID=400946 RepID=A0AB35BW03_9GAMM|nr:SurA N-terminal domain-containing protein [Wohlfahrtiimonas chitiniclastica]MBS7823879.1 SurA N-terminal domain-containing protein [Wohlfahrtiimonas chitiniclastica]MBS7839497.1 SurA N-terminal domain-containing protein [Wohlfahrtiimonas chitiniclastica]
MMQYIRERATSKFAKFLFLGIGISFLGFGGSSMMGSLGDPAVAKVNGEKISTSVLTQAYMNHLREQGGVTPEGAAALMVKKNVLNGLIQEQVMQQATEKMGIMASNEAVRDAIHKMPFLQENGQFSKQRYQYYLQQQGLTAEQWENLLRRDMTTQLLIRAISDSVIVPQESIEAFAKIDREKRDLSVISVPLARFVKDAIVTDEMLAAYYESHKHEFSTEPRVKIAYVTLPEVTNDEITVTTEEVAAKKAEILEKQKVAESRNSDQLIIQFSTEEEKQKALAALTTISDALKAGNLSFEEAKAEIEQNPEGLYYQTGNLRINGTQGIETALFGLTMDAPYSAPVVTNNAVHVVRLLAIDGNDALSDEALTAKATAAVKQSKEAAIKANHEQHFQEVAEKNSESLALLAQEFNTTPVETDWLSLTEKTGALKDQATFDMISQEMQLVGGKNSEAYQADNGEIRIVRVQAYEAARPLTFDEAKPQIETALVRSEAEKKARGLIDAINIELAEGKTLADVASKHDVTVKNYTDLSAVNINEAANNDPEIAAVLEQGFSVARTYPAAFVALSINDHVDGVIVNNIEPGKLSDYTEEELTLIGQYLRSDMANAETLLFMQGLYDQSQIEVYQVPFLTE